MSTDAKPMHNKCPEGKLSWCFYKRAKTDNKEPGSHKSMKTKLSEEAVAKIMPVYQCLVSSNSRSRVRTIEGGVTPVNHPPTEPSSNRRVPPFPSQPVR
ncbi:hypothetical protein TNCV_2900031 [Trichonephila clavipes]|nr:hypothetical protein TNCV_2900031 [Trichonephila clavipes]